MPINFIETNAKLINEFLEKELPQDNKVCDAMRYSALSGGKRLRPSMLLEFYRLCGGKSKDAIYFAAALECIHTYSLIHDDLPCMDNDELRRGKPSCHMAFGEARALLAGDSLLTFAFELCSKARDISPQNVVVAIGLLAKYSGIQGMVEGQELDLEGEGLEMDIEYIKKMYLKKTGCLFKAAAHIGCVLAGAEQDIINACTNFADLFGMAFQITDDILDICGTTSDIGKPVGSDAKNEKSTYVSLMGLDASKGASALMCERAKMELKVFGKEANELVELTDSLLNRNK